MAQIKIYGLKDNLNPIRARLSDVIHSCVVDALQFPLDKRAHRFFPLERDDFYYPAGRTEDYTIIEIMMIEGRSVETKKQLIRLRACIFAKPSSCFRLNYSWVCPETVCVGLRLQIINRDKATPRTAVRR